MYRAPQGVYIPENDILPPSPMRGIALPKTNQLWMLWTAIIPARFLFSQLFPLYLHIHTHILVLRLHIFSFTRHNTVFYHTIARNWPSYILFRLFVYIYLSPRHTLSYNNSSQVLTFCLNSLRNPHSYLHPPLKIFYRANFLIGALSR